MSKIRHNDIVIPPDGTDPFINCKLDRKQFGNVLTSIVENYADGFVLAINNPWGEGKTTFVKMWQQQLINEGFTTLFFNAWENDFEKDVLIALISELSEIKNKAEKQFKNVLQKVLPLTGSLLPSIGKHLAKRLVGDEFVEDFVEAIGEYTEEQLNEATQKYASRKKNIEEFKISLSVFAKEAGNNKPLIFIIDELDRCRPSYSVEVLEQIKHIFSIPDIVFVLSIDKEQLGNAVRGFYGSNLINADEYLRRFIDLEFVLPKPEIKDYIDYLYDYFDFDSFILSEQRKKIEVFKTDREFFKNNSLQFFSDGFNLRQIEKIFARIRITLNFFRHNQYIFPQLIVFLAYLKEKHNDVYTNTKNLKYSINQLVKTIEPILIKYINNDNNRAIIALNAIFIKFYYNNFIDYFPHSGVELGFYDSQNHGFKISFESNLEDKNKSLSRMIEYYNNQMDITDTNISFIIEKYDLTQNFINQ